MMWKFRKGGDTESPQNSAIKDFSKHIFESIVREAIQNSLDNPDLKDKKTVIVKFDFGKVRKNEVSSYENLLEHYKATKLFWHNDPSYKPIFDAIDNRIKDFNQEIPYLKISDYHTTGMDLTPREDENIRLTNYFAFTRGNNTVKSSAQAGGSEGQGKATFYAASALRTLYIHTISKYGSIFEGLTRLATHTIEGTDFSANGHLFQDIDSPQYESGEEENLWFSRNAADGNGSSICILGLWSYDDVEQKMIKSAINNFWMAIYDRDLIVHVGNTELNHTNIESLIDQYLPERSESSHTKNNPTTYGRAKCYFETWTEKFNDSIETYNEVIPILGRCTLKISQHPDYPGKIAFFRKQKMLIVRSSVNLFVSKGYCGVFICMDEQGNKILRKMEGKTHTEWDPNLCMIEEDTVLAKSAIEEMNKFIIKCWQSYRSKHFPETIELRGLAGLSIGQTRSDEKQKTSGKLKNPKTKPPRAPHQKQEFEKLGIIKNNFNSIKENGLWKYELVLNSNEAKQLNIRMLPATDAIKTSNEDLLEVTEVTSGWDISKNTIEGYVKKGVNTIEFYLNAIERVALDFKLTSHEK